jgi:integrase
MSSAAVPVQDGARFFSPTVVRRDSVLSLMAAERGDSYGDHVKGFLAFAEARGGAVDFDTIRAYFLELAGAPCAANTKRIRRQAVKARLRHAMAGMDWNQAAQLTEALRGLDHDPETRAPKVQAAPIGRERVLDREDFDRLMRAASPRTGLLLRFLWTTGCRVSELTGARLDRCKVDGSTVHVTVLGKGSKERTVRIPAALYESIRATFPGDVFLFTTGGGQAFSRVYVSTEIHKLALRVLGRRIGAHSLRHSFATRQIRRTGKIQAVSTYLGHSSTAITMGFYVHERLDDDELFDPADDE